MSVTSPRPLDRLAVLAVLGLVTLVLTVGPALDGIAAEHGDGVSTDRDRWKNKKKEEGQAGGTGGGSVSDPRERGAVYTVEEGEVDGESCWMIADGGNMTWDEAVERLAAWNDNGAAFDACDFETETTPSVFTFWVEAICPPRPPTPVTLDPQNEAVTGKPGYLAIGGNRTEAIECLGQVINAEARYVIHWGDGSTTETTSQGGEWPDGDLTHVYEDKGNYTITVEAYWTGTVGGTTLPELPVPTTATTDVQVDEVQAVVTEQH